MDVEQIPTSKRWKLLYRVKIVCSTTSGHSECFCWHKCGFMFSISEIHTIRFGRFAWTWKYIWYKDGFPRQQHYFCRNLKVFVYKIDSKSPHCVIIVYIYIGRNNSFTKRMPKGTSKKIYQNEFLQKRKRQFIFTDSRLVKLCQTSYSTSKVSWQK